MLLVSLIDMKASNGLRSQRKAFFSEEELRWVFLLASSESDERIASRNSEVERSWVVVPVACLVALLAEVGSGRRDSRWNFL